MQYESASPGALSVFGTPVALIPWPDTVGMVPGATATFFSGTVIESGEVPDADGFLARELADELSSATGGSWHAARGAWQGVVRLALDEAAAPRSYTLDVRDGGIAITGGDLEGLRYGVQTLRQMLRQCGGVLPIVRIEDAPQYAVRGYYLDVTRGRVP
ncbi:glycoside hydrolase family 20 zincin-like fold domain-containing protein, partial [Bifidobacterium scardovii]